MGRGRDKRKRLKERSRARPVLKREAHPGDLPSSEPEAFGPAPLKPKPGLRSGAIAVPEPEDSEAEITIKGFRLQITAKSVGP
jgi:hypothetical protein